MFNSNHLAAIRMNPRIHLLMRHHRRRRIRRLRRHLLYMIIILIILRRACLDPIHMRPQTFNKTRTILPPSGPLLKTNPRRPCIPPLAIAMHPSQVVQAPNRRINRRPNLSYLRLLAGTRRNSRKPQHRHHGGLIQIDIHKRGLFQVPHLNPNQTATTLGLAMGRQLHARRTMTRRDMTI